MKTRIVMVNDKYAAQVKRSWFEGWMYLSPPLMHRDEFIHCKTFYQFNDILMDTYKEAEGRLKRYNPTVKVVTS